MYVAHQDAPANGAIVLQHCRVHHGERPVSVEHLIHVGGVGHPQHSCLGQERIQAVGRR